MAVAVAEAVEAEEAVAEVEAEEAEAEEAEVEAEEAEEAVQAEEAVAEVEAEEEEAKEAEEAEVEVEAEEVEEAEELELGEAAELVAWQGADRRQVAAEAEAVPKGAGEEAPAVAPAARPPAGLAFRARPDRDPGPRWSHLGAE